MSEPMLITISEAARLLNVHPLSLRKAVARGFLPAVRPLGTRTVRLRRADVLRLVEPAAQHHPESREPLGANLRRGISA
jgi:excisionase family DNA binding protein